MKPLLRRIIGSPCAHHSAHSMAAIAADCVSLFSELTAKESNLFWLMVTFEAGKETPKVVGSGASGFNACKAALNEDVISHGVIKVLGVDNRGNVIAVRPKYVQFTYVGSGVSPLKRGQAGPQKEKLKKVFSGVQLEIQCDDITQFTQLDIAQRLLASGGAHKPTEYRFSDEAENDVITIESMLGQKHT